VKGTLSKALAKSVVSLLQERKSGTWLWFDTVALIAILGSMIGGAMMRRHLPSVPIPDSDSRGYLYPALSWLGGAGFQQSEGRDWLYPAILAGILRLPGDFSAIVRVQQCLGLMAAPMIWGSFRTWLSLFSEQTKLLYLIATPFGIIAAYLAVLNPSLALFEIAIRPEGVLGFFTLLYLFFLTAYLRARWQRHRKWEATFFGAGCLALSYAVLLLRPSWSFTLAFTFFLLVSGSLGQQGLTIRLLPLLSGTALIGALAIGPYFLGFRRDSASKLFLPTTLVSIHAAQIVHNAEKNSSNKEGKAGGLDRETLLVQALRSVLPRAKQQPGYQYLGFNPDYIKYTSNVFGRLQQTEHWSDNELATACYSAYFHTWVGSPFAMLSKIVKQLSFFFFTKAGDLYTHSVTWQQIKDHLSGREVLTTADSMPYLKNLPSYASYVERVDKAETAGWQIHGVSCLRVAAILLSGIAPWIQLAFAISLAVPFMRSEFSGARLPALAVAIAATIVYANAIVTSAAHSLGEWRYRAGYAPLFLVTLSMMAAFCLFVAARQTASAMLRSPYQS
jgi:hypothetical protein